MTKAWPVVVVAPNLMVALISPTLGGTPFREDGLTVLRALVTPVLFGVVLLQRARHLPEPIQPGIVW